MAFIRLLRLICGCVGFYAEGGFPERFINLCSVRGIPLWGLSTQNGRIFAYTTLNGYMRIRECAVKSGMRLKHTKTVGMPFFASRYRRRAGVLCGLGVFFAVIGMLSSMVWTIDITSNSKVTDEEILAVLSQAGLKPGVFKDSISAPEIRFFALSHLPDITYLTVNLIGSSVQVDVTERVECPEIPNDETPCDVISAVDGQLAVLELYSGTKLHSVGEAVSKGEVLVGGFAELADGSVRFQHAAAYAVINTQISIESDILYPTDTLYRETEEKHTTLHFFGFDIPLFIFSKSKPNYVRNNCFTVNNVRLPIGYTQKIYTSFHEKKLVYNKEYHALSTAENYFIQKINSIGGAEIISENVSADTCIKGEFTAAVSAGRAQQMLIE